jgi:L-lactate dehydrogenase complex protein LldE
MLQRKLDNIAASGAPTVVSCDGGCLTNINGGLHRGGMPQRVRHIAEILANQAG